MSDPLAADPRRPLILDGGLATGLEQRGYALHPRLWSAGVFLANPEVIEELHLAYLEAGADVLISASYQMSFEGLAAEGLDRRIAAETMRETVRAARRACGRAGRSAIVAASVGPYGAVLADGSEYRGDDGLTDGELREFHAPRLAVLRTAGADLLAIETLPSWREAAVLAELLAGCASTRAWISFSCRDNRSLRDGTPIVDAARALDNVAQVAAVGVNCTAPEHVAGLIDEILRGTSKPIVVYPNSGEVWDAEARRWSGDVDAGSFVDLAHGWFARGARAIGGCCRIGPAVIRSLARANWDTAAQPPG